MIRALRLVVLAACLAVPVAEARVGAAPGGGREAPMPAEETAIEARIGFDQRIGATVPMDLVLDDADGGRTRLGEAMAGRPVVLAMAWYDCGMLCPITLNNLATTLAALDFAAGEEFSLVVVGIDPDDGPGMARKTRGTMLAAGGIGDATGWHLLGGTKAEVDRLADAVGFRYAQDPGTGHYAHPAGLVILTPEGRVARYLFGLDVAPSDLKFALMEASDGRLGSLADKIALRCQSFDPATGTYTTTILDALRVAGSATVLVMAGAIGFWSLRARRSP
ncbi:MAG: SCO family protein [Paracoccaceae bacterium]